MQNSKKVILWGLEDLLGWTVGFFLGKKDGWEVINVSRRAEIDILLQEVEKVCPNVIVFCKGDCEDDADALMKLLQSSPEGKVVVVNTESNAIEIFKKQEIWLKEVSDLIAIVNE